MSCLGYLLCRAEPTWTRCCCQSNNSIICQWGKITYRLSYSSRNLQTQYVRTILISMNIDNFSPTVSFSVCSGDCNHNSKCRFHHCECKYFGSKRGFIRTYLEGKFWTCRIPLGCVIWDCLAIRLNLDLKTSGRQARRAACRPSVDKMCWHMGTQNLIDRGCGLNQWLTVQPESQHRQERLKIG